jgi:hypothetical protein
VEPCGQFIHDFCGVDTGVKKAQDAISGISDSELGDIYNRGYTKFRMPLVTPDNEPLPHEYLHNYCITLLFYVRMLCCNTLAL